MSCPNCQPWPVPPDCCKSVCDVQEGQDLFDLWWPAVCEWVRVETCSQFGCCDVEVIPCPPCACPDLCGCGPWQTIDLAEAFGACPIKLGDDGLPLVEFRFPQPDGSTQVVDWSTGLFTIRPDMRTLDWCRPFHTCGGWPANSDCERPWTIAATIGREVPAMLLNAAGRFVCEIVKDCLGQESCLPDGVTSITRRGLSMDVDRAGGFDETVIQFDRDNTGVPLLDMAFRTWGDCQQPFAFVDLLAGREKYRTDRWSFREVWPAAPVPLAGGVPYDPETVVL